MKYQMTLQIVAYVEVEADDVNEAFDSVMENFQMSGVDAYECSVSATTLDDGFVGETYFESC